MKEISYLPNERLPISKGDRKAIFDLYCTNEQGEKFIVELQKTKQKYFKDRTLYYSTFPIQEQAIVGQDWDFELKKVYTIAILDFVFDEDKDRPEKFRYDVKLSDIDTKKVFYDKLTFVYLEMPKFDKSEFKKYQESLNAYRDIKNSVDTAWEEGKIEGKIETAKKGLKEGYPIEMISKMTGLTEKEINGLK
ncbi:MAG: PD-(D/E)XK nuclease family transposase [Bacteroidota bacterium]|nr:PD-(D/E)XK nuclease family transposase [Bacteroidota bacterium]